EAAALDFTPQILDRAGHRVGAWEEIAPRRRLTAQKRIAAASVGRRDSVIDHFTIRRTTPDGHVWRTKNLEAVLGHQMHRNHTACRNPGLAAVNRQLGKEIKETADQATAIRLD